MLGYSITSIYDLIGLCPPVCLYITYICAVCAHQFSVTSHIENSFLHYILGAKGRESPPGLTDNS